MKLRTLLQYPNIIVISRGGESKFDINEQAQEIFIYYENDDGRTEKLIFDIDSDVEFDRELMNACWVGLKTSRFNGSSTQVTRLKFYVAQPLDLKNYEGWLKHESLMKELAKAGQLSHQDRSIEK